MRPAVSIAALLVSASSNVALADKPSQARVQCPSMKELSSRLGAGARNVPPNEFCKSWDGFNAQGCVAIGLPQAAWYVVGNLTCRGMDRTQEMHIAVDASGWNIVAIGDGGQHTHDLCNVTFRSIKDHNDAPSTVSMTKVCTFKDNPRKTTNLDAEIDPPKITLRVK